ncbi:MAG TPA: ethanolamine ammonia-lyase subunit EutC [Candidatus Acidoferrum sp.]|nr:ethanolamine ammonia-lyase subunit EutC [Candidatus Acidoferrum sp.]
MSAKENLARSAEGKIQKSLESYTSARVTLQRTGHGLATSEILNLQLANAQARDAVHAKLDLSALLDGLSRRKLAHLVLASSAATRADYLRNPSQGRSLSPDSATQLQAMSPGPPNATTYDVVFVIADGLSALAVDRHALPLLDATLPLLDPEWRVAPVCIVEQARVAIADPVGEILGAKISVILIGERPGLSSPDSLGVYITWNPRPGRSDAERNCISNIRPEGLSYREAAGLLHFYLTESRRLQQSGTLLKPTTAARTLPETTP